jgi:hypothetical protein
MRFLGKVLMTIVFLLLHKKIRENSSPCFGGEGRERVRNALEGQKDLGP